MKRALLAGLLALAACTKPGGATASQADPRLGLVVYETDTQAGGRAATATEWRPSLVRALVTQDGLTHVLVVAPPGRVFGTSDYAAPEVSYRQVDAAGAVKSLPAPRLGSEGLARAFLTESAGGHAVLVQSDPRDRARYATAHVRDGDAWTALTFQRADRPPRDTADTWGDGQLRVLGPREALAQHGGHLARWDGTTWTPVERPADAVDARLGQADATRVRLFWLAADGAVHTDTLDRATWTLSGKKASLRRATTTRFGANWGHSGTVDTYTLVLDAPGAAGDLMVLRGGGDTLRLVEFRQRYGQGNLWWDGLQLVPHPYRGLAMRGAELFSMWQGKLGPSLGRLDDQYGVTCESACTVHEGSPVGEEPGCLTCTPRAVLLASWAAAPDLSSLSVLLLDTKQDATARLYLKRRPLPFATTPLTAPFEAQPFPGDDGTRDDLGFTDGLAHIEGVLFKAGATDHAGIALAATVGTKQQLVTTGVGGAFQLDPLPPGTGTLTASAPGYAPITIPLDASAGGRVRVTGVLPSVDTVSMALRPDARTWADPEGVLQLDGGVLTRSVYLSGLHEELARNAVDARPDLMAWSDGAWLHLRTGAQGVPISADVGLEALRRLPTAAFPGAPLDGVTGVDWKVASANPAPVLLPQVADLRPHDTSHNFLWVWEVPAPGQTRLAAASGYQAPATVLTSSRASMDTPVLTDFRTANFPSGPAAVGLAGTGCGVAHRHQSPCAAWAVRWPRPSPITAVQVASDAVQVALQVDTNGFGERVAWLSRTATGGSLSVTPLGSATPVVAQSGFALPAAWEEGELPLVAVERSTTLYVRAADGLYESNGQAGDWHLLLPRVVRLEAAPHDPSTPAQPGHAVAWQAPVGTSDCAGGCTAWHLVPGRAPVALALTATGREVLTFSGLLTDRATLECPDGPCAGLQRVTWSGATTVIGPGRLLPVTRRPPSQSGMPVEAPGAVPLWLEFPSRGALVAP